MQTDSTSRQFLAFFRGAMDKEGEVLIKKIELKVHIDCCDGCKKKVQKALHSVKGVLRTEIDLQQQKVTVFGNADSRDLVERLSRVGKQVEVWTQNGISTNNKPSEQSPKDKQSSTTKEVIKEQVGTANGEENRDKTIKMNPQEPVPLSLLQGDREPNQKASGNQYIYLLQAQPIMPNMSYYAVCSYVTPVNAATNPTCYPQQNYAVERQSEAQTPLNRVGDYFNDENTVGCHVM